MSFFENTRKPEGLGGKLMLAMMNVGHRALADWGLQFAEIAKDASILDCGCGGGANIRTMLKKCPNGEVKGVDYSPVSVEKAKKGQRGCHFEWPLRHFAGECRGSHLRGEPV